MATADLLDELVFEGHEKTWMEHLEALQRTHLLVSDEVLQS